MFDTNAISDLMTGKPPVVGRLRTLNESDELLLSVVVVGEIYFGLNRLPPGKRRMQLSAEAARVLSHFRWIEIEAATAFRYASIKAEMARAGTVVSENDFWIAAHCLQYNALLVSRDAGMRSINGLTIQDWSGMA
jgi:predicted nucleic acid-binding protein